jgi:hypothetical protein
MARHHLQLQTVVSDKLVEEREERDLAQVVSVFLADVVTYELIQIELIPVSYHHLKQTR